MATTIKKFLDQQGVGVLWARVTEELNKKATNVDVDKLKTDVATLKGDANTVGSVAYQIAQIVAGADASFDTLKEVADWISTHGTDAATMNSEIASLKTLVGSEAVATQITNAVNGALKVDGVDKYALASSLTALTNRVKALEDAGYLTLEEVNSAIDAKLASADLSGSYDTKGSAATAETNAKTYADGLFANVQALTEEEVRAVIAPSAGA